MPELQKLKALATITSVGKEKEIKVDKPGSLEGKAKQNKGVKFRVMKVEKRVRSRKRRDPRARDFY